MFCPGCGKEIKEQENICTECGYVLKKRFCPKCGRLIASDRDKFCVSCGAKLLFGRDSYNVLYGCPTARQIRGVVPDCMLKQGGVLTEKEY